MKAHSGWLVSFLAVILGAGAAAADPAVDCPSGNLLHGRRAITTTAIQGDAARLTDHFVAPEGAAEEGPQAVVFLEPGAQVVWDLSREVNLRHLVTQTGGRGTYQVATSRDGQDFTLLWEIPAAGAGGLRRGAIDLAEPRLARYVRVGAPQGERPWAMAELQVFCERPTPFPPKIPEFSTTPPPKKDRPWWNNDRSARSQLVLALVGLIFLGLWQRLASRPKLRDGICASLGLLAFGSFFNFGAFHFPGFVHDWEFTHYYLGAKYFEELSYDKLYECIAVADATVADAHAGADTAKGKAAAGLAQRVRERKITNLRTNVLEGTAEILAHPNRCTDEFSPQRWRDFQADVGFFRQRQSSSRWEALQTDHGYNATPVWTVAGTLLANLGPASEGQLHGLAALDPLYLVALVAILAWAFGWRVTCVALLVLATHFPARFYWTGGAFLRWDWLFFTAAALACWRRDKPLLAGMALGYAALLRIFPLLIFAGPLLAAAALYWRERRLDRNYLRFFGGAALAAALLLPLGAWACGGFAAYGQFVANTVKHKETPLTNHMGLRTLVAYRPSEAGRFLHDDRAVDPWLEWKKARLAAFQRAKPVFALLLASFLALLAVAVRGREPWITVALGIVAIPFGVELTCYYYAFLVGLAVLHAVDRRVGIVLLAVNVATHILDWRPFELLPGWRDEQYTWMSAATLLGLVVILAFFVRQAPDPSSKS